METIGFSKFEMVTAEEISSYLEDFNGLDVEINIQGDGSLFTISVYGEHPYSELCLCNELWEDDKEYISLKKKFEARHK